MEAGWRHQIVRVIRDDALPGRTLVRIAGDDAFELGVVRKSSVSTLGGVQSQVGLAGVGVEAVTGKTGVREDGSDVGVERDLVGQLFLNDWDCLFSPVFV